MLIIKERKKPKPWVTPLSLHRLHAAVVQTAGATCTTATETDILLFSRHSYVNECWWMEMRCYTWWATSTFTWTKRQSYLTHWSLNLFPSRTRHKKMSHNDGPSTSFYWLNTILQRHLWQKTNILSICIASFLVTRYYMESFYKMNTWLEIEIKSQKLYSCTEPKGQSIQNSIII